MSIHRVAERARVSAATVSRVINRRGNVSPESVKRVEAAMRELDYVPPAKRRGRKPRGMRGVKTHNVAVLLLREFSGNAIISSLLDGVGRLLQARELNLIFARVSSKEELPPAVRSGEVDGVMGYGTFPDALVSERLARVPAVWMMTREKGGADLWGDRVKPDNTAVGRLAAEYLAGRGHRALAYITPEPHTSASYARGEGFASEAKARGVTAHTFAARVTGSHEAIIAQQVDDFRRTVPRPTGLFVPADRVAAVADRCLRKAGLQPRRDVELVSCDNDREILDLLDPAPRSIDLNWRTIGQLAVERLFWRMEHGLDAPQVTLTVSPSPATE